MAQRALITGVTGFAGSFLAEHLLACGDAVLGCSTAGQWTGPAGAVLAGQVDLLAWDLSRDEGPDPPTLRRIAQFAPTCIYHLAAISVPEDCGPVEPLPQVLKINVGGTRQVLRLAAALPTGPRVLVVSSSHVYASPPREAPMVAETTPPAPRGGYGRSKLAAEQEGLRAASAGGCEVVIARAFPHAGPRQSPQRMLSQWAQQFAQGASDRPVEIQTRDARIDLSDVRDVVRAYRLLLVHGSSGEVYNVGSGICRTSGEVFEIMRRLADPHRLVRETAPGFKQDPIADTSRLRRRTGWRAAIPLEQTVSDTLAWWRAQAAGAVAQAAGLSPEGSPCPEEERRESR